MTTQKTCCNINHSTGWPSRCTKPAKVERDGKHYCGVHDPVRIAEKNHKRNAEWQVKWDAEKAEHEAMKQKTSEQKRRADCYDDLLEALISARKLWGDYLPARSSNVMRSIRLVDAAIAKSTGAA